MKKKIGQYGRHLIALRESRFACICGGKARKIKNGIMIIQSPGFTDYGEM